MLLAALSQLGAIARENLQQIWDSTQGILHERNYYWNGHGPVFDFGHVG